jgi:hypothetical protein
MLKSFDFIAQRAAGDTKKSEHNETGFPPEMNLRGSKKFYKEDRVLGTLECLILLLNALKLHLNLLNFQNQKKMSNEKTQVEGGYPPL